MFGGCGKGESFIITLLKKSVNGKKMMSLLKNKLFIAAVILIILILSILFSKYNLYKLEKLDIKVEVGDGVGLDVSNDYVGFGIVSNGNSAARDIILSHSYDKNLMIKMHVEGELRDWIVFSENDFVLEPGVEKKVGVSLFVPKEASKGKYESELIVVYKKII